MYGKFITSEINIHMRVAQKKTYCLDSELYDIYKRILSKLNTKLYPINYKTNSSPLLLSVKKMEELAKLTNSQLRSS